MSSMSLNDLTDVTISNPTIDQKIAYDGTQWVNYYAKILLTYDTFFQGKTITISQGGSSSTATLPLNETETILLVPSKGEYGITYTESGHTYSASVDVFDSGELYYATLLSVDTINVTLYSATGDTLTYTDADGVQKTAVFDTNSSSKLVTLSIIPSGISITFTSTVALDPNDCIPEDASSQPGQLRGSYYSKTITVTSQTTEIYIMPNGALYWYGWMKENEFEKMTTANGWTWQGSSSYTLGIALWDKNVIVNNHTSSDSNRDYTKTVGTSTISKKTGLSSMYAVVSSGGWDGSVTLFTSKNVYSRGTMTDKLADKPIRSVTGRARFTVDLTPYISNEYYLAFVGYVTGYDINVWAVVVTESE